MANFITEAIREMNRLQENGESIPGYVSPDTIDAAFAGIAPDYNFGEINVKISPADENGALVTIGNIIYQIPIRTVFLTTSAFSGLHLRYKEAIKNKTSLDTIFAELEKLRDILSGYVIEG
ncbi:MAG: hypothetical protein ABIM99_03440 [Candidatus Dojkabacteria bacterium]